MIASSREGQDGATLLTTALRHEGHFFPSGWEEHQKLSNHHSEKTLYRKRHPWWSRWLLLPPLPSQYVYDWRRVSKDISQLEKTEPEGNWAHKAEGMGLWAGAWWQDWGRGYPASLRWQRAAGQGCLLRATPLSPSPGCWPSAVWPGQAAMVSLSGCPSSPISGSWLSGSIVHLSLFI